MYSVSSRLTGAYGADIEPVDPKTKVTLVSTKVLANQ